MKISELISELVEVIAQRGDLQVFFYDGASKYPLEVLGIPPSNRQHCRHRQKVL